MGLPSRPGWYDDPDEPEQLRYFDGILWTANTTPRRTRWDLSPAPVAADPAAGPTRDTGADPRQWSPRSGQPAPHSSGAPNGPTTEDGVPLASYLQRVAAYLIDYLLTGIITGVLGGYFAWQAMAPVLDQVGATPVGTLPDFTAALEAVDRGPMAIFIGIQLLVGLFYHAAFIAKLGATPGKFALGISVRRPQHPGVIGWDGAFRRAGFWTVLAALRNVGAIGFVALLATVLDLVWPLVDRRRQAWHDKVADTLVVKGRQPR